MDNRSVGLSTGVDLSILEAGAGAGHHLMLVHGFTGAKEDFADHVDALALASAGAASTGNGGWHVVAPDLRGHGASSAPPGADSYGLKIFAADILALADALGWDRFALLGHSMGGMAAQHAALEAPERIAGLVLMDTAPGPMGGVDPDVIALGKSVVSAGGMALLVKAQREREGELTSAADRRLRETRPGYAAFGEAKALACAGDMWLAMVDEIVTTQPDRLRDLAGLTVPILVMVGEQDRPLVPHARAMAATIPGARLEIIADAGHSPQFENPAAWFGALVAFLGKLH